MRTQTFAAEDWDEIATGYDALVTPINVGSGETAIGLVSLGTGERFLDVAAGSGALSLPAARVGAEVVATDVSPAMVQGLAERARKAGLSNLQARVMDGTALDLEDDSFDVAGSQHGVSLFPDMQQGLAEMVRVVRPGGRVLISAFGPLETAGFVFTFLQAIQAAAPHLPLPTAKDPPPPFQVADPDELGRRLAKAGLQEVQVEIVTHQATFPSAERYWETLVNSNPIGKALGSRLDAAQRRHALEVIDAALREHPTAEGGGVLTTELNVGIGTTPGGAA